MTASAIASDSFGIVSSFVIPCTRCSSGARGTVPRGRSRASAPTPPPPRARARRAGRRPRLPPPPSSPPQLVAGDDGGVAQLPPLEPPPPPVGAGIAARVADEPVRDRL